MSTSTRLFAEPNLLVSSFLIGWVTYNLASIAFNAILVVDDQRLAIWHREEARWSRLRQSSSLFRNLQRWIVGISLCVEQYAPWFVELPNSKQFAIRITGICFRTVFGNSNRLNQAVRVGSAVEPWHPSEIVSCGLLLASFFTVFMAMAMVDGPVTSRYVATVSLSWIAVYRLWCFRVVMRGELRRKQVRRFLPHAMDSIAMVMASGGTFRSGIDSVIGDFPDHPLSQELSRLRNELERGQTMTQALLSSAKSICLPEFDEMVRVLARIHQHGTPASDSFVRLAKQLRISHLRHMEDEVGRAEASMALPTMLVMISCMIVAVAPFALSIMGSSFFE